MAFIVDINTTQTYKKQTRSTGYTMVWSGLHECNECISRETMV